MNYKIKKYLRQTINSIGYEIKKCQVSEDRKWQWLKNENIKIILDVGANVGKWAIEISPYFPSAEIYSFEPIKECFDKLILNTSNNYKIHGYNVAVGSLSEKREIYKSDHISSSSLLKMGELHSTAFPDSRGYTREKIRLITLDEFCSDHDISGEIFMKIDVQGFEKEVLGGAKECLKNVRVILMEVSYHTLYEGQPLFHEMYTYMRERGFEYRGDFESIKNPIDGSILQANAIFKNNK